MTKWRIPEDGIVDHLAVTLAIDAVRPVRLTPTEQRQACAVMLTRGYGIETIAERLHLSWSEARRMELSLRAEAAGEVSQAS